MVQTFQGSIEVQAVEQDTGSADEQSQNLAVGRLLHNWPSNNWGPMAVVSLT